MISETLKQLLLRIPLEQELIYATISAAVAKGSFLFSKVTIKPVPVKGKILFQFEYHYDKKVTHENLEKPDCIQKILEYMDNGFRQLMLWTTQADFHILSSERQEVKVVQKAATRIRTELQHDRAKPYILQENTPIDFLIALGVMNEAGQVYQKKYDKFRQINKFLEFLYDAVQKAGFQPSFLRIIDFGCGKAYLTFAMAHLLVNTLGYSVQITGLDLKEEVIRFCNGVVRERSTPAGKLAYSGLSFEVGEIASYELKEQPDIVVMLHACDTATDEALCKAIEWNTRLILSVPCCQHELFDHIDHPQMKPLLKHGILKEKLNAVVTDALRALLLETFGYEVSVMEFIDMEHTPKNVLIRAIRRRAGFQQDKYLALIDFLRAWNLKNTYIQKWLERTIPA